MYGLLDKTPNGTRKFDSLFRVGCHEVTVDTSRRTTEDNKHGIPQIICHIFIHSHLNVDLDDYPPSTVKIISKGDLRKT